MHRVHARRSRHEASGLRSLWNWDAIEHENVQRLVHLGRVVRLEHVLPVRREAVAVLRARPVGMVLRQRLRVDAGLCALLRAELQLLSYGAVTPFRPWRAK